MQRGFAGVVACFAGGRRVGDEVVGDVILGFPKVANPPAAVLTWPRTSCRLLRRASASSEGRASVRIWDLLPLFLGLCVRASVGRFSCRRDVVVPRLCPPHHPGGHPCEGMTAGRGYARQGEKGGKAYVTGDGGWAGSGRGGVLEAGGWSTQWYWSSGSGVGSDPSPNS
jgi:hypothetical protein